MSIREEARQEAERRWPDVDAWRMGVNAEREWRRRAFIDGASWASEQADREPSERLMVAPAIQAVRDVLDGLEDWEIQDHALEEIRSAVDDIPDCESATAAPHDEHGEPSDAEACLVCERTDGTHKMSCRPQNRADAERHRSDAEVEHVAFALLQEGLRLRPPGISGQVVPYVTDEHRSLARAALLAAQEVRRG